MRPSCFNRYLVPLDIDQLMNEAIRHVVQGAIESVIGQRTGSAIQGDVKDAIKAEAAAILKEPEMQRIIRARITHWINEQ